MRSLPFEIDLRRKSGDSERFVIRKMTAEDADLFLSLQDEVYSGMPDRDHFVLVSREEFLDHVENDACFAALSGGVLAGATVMVANRLTPLNAGYYVGMAEEELLKNASLDSTIVAAEFRGYGLQRLFVELREEAAVDSGAETIMVTVSPDNSYSLSNLKRSGYEIVVRRELYGGLDRYILRKNLINKDPVHKDLVQKDLVHKEK